MKRTLSLILALVMVIGMIPVFAATPAEEAGAVLEEMGVLKGWNGDLMLGQELKRQDSVVMFARLLGEEAKAAAMTTKPTWKDISISYYVPFMAWAQEEGHYKGYNNDTFGFNDVITAQDYALVLLRALGHKDVEWKDAYAKALELKLTADVGATTKITRGAMAEMTLAALGTKMADSEMTLAEHLKLTIPMENDMEVTATGAKELTVKFKKAVDPDAVKLTVKKGTITVNLKDTKVASGNMEAKIHTVTNLTEGEYTVTATGITEEAITATVKVQNVKVTTIRLTSDKAPLKGFGTGENNMATVGYEVLNQYGEPMNDTVTWTASAQVTPDTSKKLLNLYAGDNAFFTVGQQVVITGVHAQTATVFNGTVTIAAPSNVAEFEFKGVYNLDSKKFEDVKAGFVGEYELLFLAKDQYGTKVDVTNANAVFTSLNPIVVKIDNPAELTTQTVGGVKYQGIKLRKGDYAINGGSVTVNAISLGSGKTGSFTFEVAPAARLKSFTLSTPAELVAGNDSEVEIPFTAVDQFGNEITKYDALNAALTPNNNNIKELQLSDKLVLRRQNDGTAKLYYTVSPNTSTVDRIEVATALVTGTGSFSQIQINIKPDAKAKVVVGFKPAIKTNLVIGQNQLIEPKNVNVEDQYGRTKTADKFPISLKMKFADMPENTPEPLTLTTENTVNAVSKGSRVLTVSIADPSETGEGADQILNNSEFTQTFTAYELIDIKTLEVKDFPLVQAGKSTEIVVVGKTSDGQEVKLDATTVIKQVGSSNGNVTQNSVEKDKLDVVAFTGADQTATLTITLDAGNGPVIVTKEMAISNKAPYAVKVVAKDVDSDELEYGLQQSTEDLAAAVLLDAKDLFTVTDQYGKDNEVTTMGVVTISDVVNLGGNSRQAKATLVTPNGLTASQIVYYSVQ